jgi:hypothetical protein
MGPDPCRCGPGRRVAYIPSAALVARRSALLAVGGFDEELRFGEDVDLCFRLDVAGWSVRYSPELEVQHLPRPSHAAFAAQRFHYGGSAAILDRRHPTLVAPLIVSRRTAAVLAAATIGAARSPRAGAAAGALAVACSGASAAFKGGRDAGPTVASLALHGHAIAGRQLARAIVRDWLPLSAAACLVSRRARQVTALALTVDSLAVLWNGESAAGTDRRLALRQLDHAPYTVGLWTGIVRDRSVAAARPAWSREASAPPRTSR